MLDASVGSARHSAIARSSVDLFVPFFPITSVIGRGAPSPAAVIRTSRLRKPRTFFNRQAGQ